MKSLSSAKVVLGSKPPIFLKALGKQPIMAPRAPG